MGEMAFAWTDFREDEIQARVFNKPGLLGYFFSSYGYWMPISTGFVPAMFRTTYFIVYGKYQGHRWWVFIVRYFLFLAQALCMGLLFDYPKAQITCILGLELMILAVILSCPH